MHVEGDADVFHHRRLLERLVLASGKHSIVSIADFLSSRYGRARGLEYDFVVKPGADASRIQLAFEGALLPADQRGGRFAVWATTRMERPRRDFVYLSCFIRRDLRRAALFL